MTVLDVWGRRLRCPHLPAQADRYHQHRSPAGRIALAMYKCTRVAVVDDMPEEAVLGHTPEQPNVVFELGWSFPTVACFLVNGRTPWRALGKQAEKRRRKINERRRNNSPSRQLRPCRVARLRFTPGWVARRRTLTDGLASETADTVLIHCCLPVCTVLCRRCVVELACTGMMCLTLARFSDGSSCCQSLSGAHRHIPFLSIGGPGGRSAVMAVLDSVEKASARTVLSPSTLPSWATLLDSTAGEIQTRTSPCH